MGTKHDIKRYVSGGRNYILCDVVSSCIGEPIDTNPKYTCALTRTEKVSVVPFGLQ